MRCLLVDDEALCELLEMSLIKSGFDATVVHSGEAAVPAILSEKFDIVLLDMMLPGLDGLGVLRRVRAASSIPIIIITAKGGEQETVLGLEAGADDYLAKPVRGRELIARMRSLLRHISVEPEEHSARYGDLELSAGFSRVRVAGKEIRLTNVEASILSVLCQHAHRPVSRDVLYRLVLRRENSPFDRSIDTHVSNLRRKIGSRADGIARIVAVRGVGYKFCF